VIWRYHQRDRLFGVRPLTVVEDMPDLTALWLAAGTVVAKPLPVTGEGSMRALGLERMYGTDWVPTPETWRGEGVLKLVPWGAAHSIWLFWGPDWEFRGWYANLERPHVRCDHTIETSDWTLDVWVEPDRAWEWKDEHELPVAVETGFLTQDEADAARSEGERVIGMIERWEGPFADGWEHWRPDPSWPVPELPDGWDRES
jgi:hypothetical protein